jgi:gamma-glutamyl-gamma-aminobutyrate hydrolase PuuD
MLLRNLFLLLVCSFVAFAEHKAKVVGIVINKTDESDIAQNTDAKHPYGEYGYYSSRDHYAEAIYNLCDNVHVIYLKPDVKSIEVYSKIIDGLLLPGLTSDIDPVLYSEKQVVKFDVDKHRSKFEIALLKEFKKTNKPVLGICHGLQIMNVAFGGNLYQDLPTQKPESKINHNPFSNANATVHEVTVVSKAHYLFGMNAPRYAVNSMHHQAVKDVAKGFSVIARSDDGVIEGIQMNSHPFFVGVQWHPEFELSKYDQNLIQSFCAAVHGENISGEKPRIKAKLL